MAVSRVSPGDPHTVRPVTEGSQYKLWAHTAGTGYTDYPEIRGILKTAHACQISGSVTAPVTKKGRNLRLPVVHTFLLHFINHGHDLILCKSLEVYGPGSAGCHAQAAALAQYRVYLRLARKSSLFDH